MKLIDNLALALSIIGGLNWLLVGLFDINVVTAIFGSGTVSTVVYVIIGIASLWCIKYFSYVPASKRRNH